MKELFAMVDGDLKEHGQWFDGVGIRQEWVLGDAATKIERIRGIFVMDKICTNHSGNHTTTSRILQLILIDDRWQKWTTDFKHPDELRAAAECLALKIPGARRGSNDQWIDFLDIDDAAQKDFEREFRRNKSRRAPAELQRETLSGGAQDIVLSAGGEVTSRVSTSLVEDYLRRCLSGEARSFTLTPTRPVEGSSQTFRAIHVSASDGTVWLGAETADGASIATKGVEEREARRVLVAWLRREVPDTTGWEMQRMVDPSLHNPTPQTARRTRQDKLRFFITKTTHQQAAAWLLAYSKGEFLPGGPGWKDYTKEIENG